MGTWKIEVLELTKKGDQQIIHWSGPTIIKLMIASRIQNSAAAAAGFCILKSGIKEVIVASKIQKSAAAAAEFRI